ncbi:MAG: hypothetical protein P4M12_02335 [Gammaproteobacteria bacterium]|nr:hypothetical protein [Gammaproteobacteria bacterium]
MQSTNNIVANLTAQKVQSEMVDGAAGAFKNGSPLIAAGLGISAAAIAGTLYAANEYHEHKKNRQLREIKQIEELRSKRIKMPSSTNQEPPLCVIFQFDKENPNLAKSSGASKQELVTLVSARPTIDIALSTYSDCIMAAMQQLYAFYLARFERKNYFRRGTEEDITSAVLRYLIRMLHDHGKKFEGYERSISIIKGIRGFINDFCRLHGENTERHARLQPVCNKLSDAIDELTKHNEKLSLDELIGEAWPDCEEVTRNMMITYTKLITPIEDWIYIERSWDPLYICKGIIQPEFADGHWGTHRNAVFLLDSIFSDNLKKLALNFYSAKINDNLLVESLEKRGGYELKLKDFTDNEQSELNSILKNKCHNFISLTSQLKKPYSANADLVPIESKTMLKSRTALLINYSDVINQMISCIKLFFRLSKYAKAMGELFVSNPNNGKFIFDVLLSLGKLVTANINALETEFIKIEMGYKNASLGSEQRDLLDEIKANFTTAKHQLSLSIDRIMKHRDIINYNRIKAEIHLDDHALLKVAHNIALMHGIPHSHNTKDNTAHVTKNSSPPINNENDSDTSPQSNDSHPEDECQEEKHQSPQRNSNLDAENEEKQSEVPLNTMPTTPLVEEHLDDIKTPINLKDIDGKIHSVQNKLLRFPTDNIRAPYNLILHELMILRDKAEQLQKTLTSTSQKKANRVKILTYNVTNCILTLLTSDYPRLEVMKNISRNLRSKDNELLDKHRTTYGRFFKFKTDSRKKLDNLEKAVTEIVRTEFRS